MANDRLGIDAIHLGFALAGTLASPFEIARVLRQFATGEKIDYAALGTPMLHERFAKLNQGKRLRLGILLSMIEEGARLRTGWTTQEPDIADELEQMWSRGELGHLDVNLIAPFDRLRLGIPL